MGKKNLSISISYLYEPDFSRITSIKNQKKGIKLIESYHILSVNIYIHLQVHAN